MDMQELYARFDDARQAKGRWLGTYERLYRLVLPNRDAFNVKWNYQDSGKPTTETIWDPTAEIAAMQRAADMQSLMIPKDRVWGKYVLDPHLYSEDEIAQLQPLVDESNDMINFFLNESNLSREGYGACLDLTGGTGAMWVESPDDETPINFRSIPAVCTYIEQTSDDVVDTCWYETKIKGYKLLNLFPDLSGKALDTISDNPSRDYAIAYGQIYKDKKYYIYAILPDIDPLTPIWETERSYKQIIVFRDNVRPGESEGRGVGINLLPTISDLNKMCEATQKNMAYKADPPVFYDNDSMFNVSSIRGWQGAMIARRPNGRNPLEAMQMPIFPDVYQREEKLREFIIKAFQVDPLGEVDSPVKSATEISVRENRAQRSSATNISRIINEFPKQIFEVAAKILAERRLLTRDRSIGNINTRALKFDFQSPLFDIQKQENLNSLTQNLQMKQQFLGEGAALASLDIGETNEFMTKNSNLPAKLFRGKDEMNKLMQALGEMQQPAPQPTPSTAAAEVELPQPTPELF